MTEVIDVLAETARRWANADHPPRAQAVEATLESDNRFTLEALAFAIDQQMEQVTPEALRAWVGEGSTNASAVGVLNAGNVPLAGFQDLLAVLASNHGYVGVTSSKSPFLLPAFVEDAGGIVAQRARFVDYGEMFGLISALIVTGSDETLESVRADANRAGIPDDRMLLRGHRFSIAVMDGRETDHEVDGLAEDILLHEGLGCRNVAIVFAPADLSPDKLLDAMARFRAVFPAHERTPGSLQMHKAMLAAVDAPHAYGEGLEFLVSKGVPEVQVPGHLRWSEYDNLAEVASWINDNTSVVQIVVARDRVVAQLDAAADFVAPGNSQRPGLAWRADGVDVISFLKSL